uniref:Uncharacterized protein n=1 Tax=Candidatus Methanogaster sp. ANME-2c ERB4 TaxID=2759911 RepID=A0A7G9YBA1_9EURY|nr:hypothetical protein GHMBFEBI_00019 [Methanosarcinales archaeon ANME-2c ERB4]QNO46842.1 hypothetical protein LLDJECOC_00003 [Methanosarcinales archaeon ANME-2c ERB4]
MGQLYGTLYDGFYRLTDGLGVDLCSAPRRIGSSAFRPERQKIKGNNPEYPVNPV